MGVRVGVGVALVVGVARGRARARRGRERRVMSEGFIIFLGLVFLLEVRRFLGLRLQSSDRKMRLSSND